MLCHKMRVGGYAVTQAIYLIKPSLDMPAIDTVVADSLLIYRIFNRLTIKYTYWYNNIPAPYVFVKNVHKHH